MIDIPMANIIAVVAVLEIHAGNKRRDRAESNKIREGRAPIHFQRQHAVSETLVQIVQKNRPRENKRADKQKHQRIGERRENRLCGATFSRTHSAAPIKAVTGIGKLSQIHKMITTEMTAARLCASGFKFKGAKK
jgi:hypothetical protein